MIRGARPPSDSASHTPEPKPPGEDALLHGHEQVVLGRELGEQAGVERLGEARVGDGDVEAALGQQVGGAERHAATPVP